MGNHASRPSDIGTDGDEEPQMRRGRKASKAISKITLFVVIGNKALFEVKRTQHAIPHGADDAEGTTVSKSDIQISIRQIPITGNPEAEEVMTTEDITSIKLHKARRNSIHSFSLNFDRERTNSTSAEFPSGSPNEADLTPSDPSVFVRIELEIAEDGESVKVELNCTPHSDANPAEDKSARDDDTESDSSESSSFAMQISKLAASAIESENETVEKWGEKLAKAIESKIGLPTSVVIKKSHRRKHKKKKLSKSDSRHSTDQQQPELPTAKLYQPTDTQD